MTFGEIKEGELFNTKPDRYMKTELLWRIDGDTRTKTNTISIFKNPGVGYFFPDEYDDVIVMGRMRL